MNILRALDTVALQGAEIIAVAEISEQLFKNRPIAVAAAAPNSRSRWRLISSWMRSLSAAYC